MRSYIGKKITYIWYHIQQEKNQRKHRYRIAKSHGTGPFRDFIFTHLLHKDFSHIVQVLIRIAKMEFPEKFSLSGKFDGK
jgi:hypothetical protein